MASQKEKCVMQTSFLLIYCEEVLICNDLYKRKFRGHLQKKARLLNVKNALSEEEEEED